MLLEVLIVIGINSCINRDSNSISNSCRKEVIAAALKVLVIVILIVLVIVKLISPSSTCDVTKGMDCEMTASELDMIRGNSHCSMELLP